MKICKEEPVKANSGRFIILRRKRRKENLDKVYRKRIEI